MVLLKISVWIKIASIFWQNHQPQTVPWWHSDISKLVSNPWSEHYICRKHSFLKNVSQTISFLAHIVSSFSIEDIYNTDHKVNLNFLANIWSVQLLNMNKFWSSRPKGDWLCWYEPNIIVLQKGRQMASVCGIGPNFGHICSPWLESSDCSTGLGQITSIQVPPIIGKFTQTLETVDRGAAASFSFGFRFTSLSLLLPLLHFHFCQSDLTFIIHTSYYWQFTQTWKQLTGSVIWLQVSSTGWEEIHFTI